MNKTPGTYTDKVSDSAQSIDYKEFERILKEKDSKIAELQADVMYYKQELGKIKRMLFGPKRERYIPGDDGQQRFSFVDELESQETENEEEKISYTRRKNNTKSKKKARRQILPSHLPRKEYIIVPDNIPEGARQIGQNITEILEYEPGRFFIKVYIRPKYLVELAAYNKDNNTDYTSGKALADSESTTETQNDGSSEDSAVSTQTSVSSPDKQTDTKYPPVETKTESYTDNTNNEPDSKIIVADLPSFPIPKGNAGPGLLAHLFISKYVDHIPFYRQAQMFKRREIIIAESTINGWFARCSDLLALLYEQSKKHIHSSNYLMVDESPIRVLTKNKPGSTHKGWFWVYYSPLNKTVYFEYLKGRGRDGPAKTLKNYTGALQSDGYVVYDVFEKKTQVSLLACMAHVRRKFYEAKNNAPQEAEYALGLIGKLYDIERVAREGQYTYHQRHQLRNQKAHPLMLEFEQWLRATHINVLPKSAIGKAIAYTLSLWPRLMRYLDDGRYEIDNNWVENSIRPVALGRKNYLFAGSHKAAWRAAMFYSFLGSCKINNVNPFEWLKHVLTVIADYKVNKLDELLPVNFHKNNTQ